MEEMSITDITTRRFTTGRRGYDRHEVDAFMSRVAGALQNEREELRAALRRIEELEERLQSARHEAARGPEAMLHASEMKQRLLEDATERAVQILRAGYEATLTDEEEIARMVDAERVELVAIWDTDEDGTPLLDVPSDETRYHRRSAHLPPIGDTTKVFDALAELRSRGLRNS